MRILIVDPDIVGSRFLKFVFQAQGYDDLRLVSTGHEALSHVQTADCGLVITEIDLPDMHGGELCEFLRRYNHLKPIIVVSENTSVMDRIRAFDAGADDVIGKPIDPPEFMARVAAVTSRYHHDDQQHVSRTLRVGNAELSVKDLRLSFDGSPTIHLTPTEWRLMECLMRNADVALSRDTLVNRIWGFDVFGDSNRLDVYIRRLRQKIEQDPTSPEYLITVRSVGYAFHSGHHSRDCWLENETTRDTYPSSRILAPDESGGEASLDRDFTGTLFDDPTGLEELAG